MADGHGIIGGAGGAAQPTSPAFISSHTGVVDAGKGIEANASGLIDCSLLEHCGFHGGDSTGSSFTNSGQGTKWNGNSIATFGGVTHSAGNIVVPKTGRYQIYGHFITVSRSQVANDNLAIHFYVGATLTRQIAQYADASGTSQRSAGGSANVLLTAGQTVSFHLRAGTGDPVTSLAAATNANYYGLYYLGK